MGWYVQEIVIPFSYIFGHAILGVM